MEDIVAKVCVFKTEFESIQEVKRAQKGPPHSMMNKSPGLSLLFLVVVLFLQEDHDAITFASIW